MAAIKPLLQTGENRSTLKPADNLIAHCETIKAGMRNYANRICESFFVAIFSSEKQHSDESAPPLSSHEK